MNLIELAHDYEKSVRAAEEAGGKLGEALIKIIEQVIPDIEFSLGWAEAGVDTLCFWSKSHSVSMIDIWSDKYTPMSDILEEYFPEINIDCPFGVYLTKDEERRLRTLLNKAMRGE